MSHALFAFGPTEPTHHNLVVLQVDSALMATFKFERWRSYAANALIVGDNRQRLCRHILSFCFLKLNRPTHAFGSVIVIRRRNPWIKPLQFLGLCCNFPLMEGRIRGKAALDCLRGLLDSQARYPSSYARGYSIACIVVAGAAACSGSLNALIRRM